MSEIVGTLFLVLIVVSAATAFSIFVAQYQRQLQAQQAQAHERSLESIHLFHPQPTLNATAGTWVSLNFTLASGDVNRMQVREITINNNPLKRYDAFGLNVDTGATGWTTVLAGGQLAVDPHNRFSIIVNFTGGNSSSFFFPFVLLSTDYLKIDVLTVLDNQFTAAYIPPDAIALIVPLQKWNGTAFVTVPELDGSSSFQSGNASLVQWSWHVTPDNQTVIGERAVAPFTNLTALTHNVTLTVTNTDGLEAVDTIHYP